MDIDECLLEIESENRGIKIEGEIEDIIYTDCGGNISTRRIPIPKTLYSLIVDPLPQGINVHSGEEYFSMNIYKDFIEFAASEGIGGIVPIYITDEKKKELDDSAEKRWLEWIGEPGTSRKEMPTDDMVVQIFKGILEYNSEKIATFGDYRKASSGMSYEKWREMPFREETLRGINDTIWQWVVKKSVFLKIKYRDGRERSLSHFRGDFQTTDNKVKGEEA